MDFLFELIFIAAILLFPFLEQVLRRGRAGGERPDAPTDAPPDRDTQPEVETADREPAPAADMVPEDLWAVLTGESRSGRSAPPVEVEERPGTYDERPWEEEAGAKPTERSGAESPWWQPEAEPGLEPVSLEYEGPEAYSLEQTDVEPVSMERPLPTPEERHEAFHRVIDREPRRPKRSRSAFARALGDARSVRQAVVLKEILGPPKGLDPTP